MPPKEGGNITTALGIITIIMIIGVGDLGFYFFSRLP